MLANDWRNYEMMGDYISHHGILGQKWGIRRFQNPDGRLTAEGKKRYRVNKIGQVYKKNIFGKDVLTKEAKELETIAKEVSDQEFSNMSDKHIRERVDAYKKWLDAEQQWYWSDGKPNGDDPEIQKMRQKLQENLGEAYQKLEDSDREKFRSRFDVADNDEKTFKFIDNAFYENADKKIWTQAIDEMKNDPNQRKYEEEYIKNRHRESSINRSIDVKNMGDFKDKYEKVDFRTTSEFIDDWNSTGDRHKRLDDAADAGINALKKIRPNAMDWDEEMKSDKNSLRDWFMFEDQTIGMGTISDLKNQGYSKEDLKKLVNDAHEAYYSHDEKKGVPKRFKSMAFELSYGLSNDGGFIDALYPDEKVEHSDSADEIYHALFGVDDAIMDHLAHHGILGMKWGIRRFQNPDGTRTPAGKARYNEGGDKPSNPIKAVGDAIKKSKTDKQRKAALEKAREAKRKKAEEAKAAEQHEADKKKALESGDYKQIQKYANEVSTAELRTAMDRARALSDLNQEVEKRTPKEKDIWSTIDDVANKVGTATNAFNKGKDAWNAFAKAANTFMDEDSMLPEIGTNLAEQKEKKRKEREENERKAKVEEVTKSLDPDKIMKNQQLFTDKELSSAVARLTAYNNVKKEKKAQEDEKAAEKQKKLDAKAEKKAEKEAKKLKKALEEASSKPLDSNDGLEYINMLENDNSRMNFSDPKYDHITDDWDFF